MENLYNEISSVTDLISSMYELEQVDVIKEPDYKELVYHLQNRMIAALYEYNKEEKCSQSDQKET